MNPVLKVIPMDFLIAHSPNGGNEMTYDLLDLFSGVGCFSLGLERSGGFRTAAFCEIMPHARRVLAKHWAGVPCYDDVRLLTASVLERDGISVNAICGGFPCQNVSNAAAAHGGHTGLDGPESGLWSEYLRLIRELRPEVAILENVTALLGRGLGTILGDLAALGYDAQWDCVRASSIGLPQPRDRIWIVAHPSEKRMPRLFTRERVGKAGQGWEGRKADLQHVADAALSGGNSFPQPLLRRVDDRPADWMDRVGECGNAVVPQVVEMIGRAILENAA